MPKLDQEIQRLIELSGKALAAPLGDVEFDFRNELAVWFRAHAPALLEAERDAGRYRWLRSNDRLLNITIEQFSPVHQTLHGDFADRVIDAEIQRYDAAIDSKLRGGES